MKLHRLALICGVLIAAIASPVDAAIYKWVDKDGRVKYGDRPPPPTEAAQSQEINRSGVPLALQRRLRELDPGVTITRITGNLEVAWVCLEYSSEEEGNEPRFVSALQSSALGTIKHSANRYNNYQYDEDDYARARNRKVADNKCPASPVSGVNRLRRVYEIRFDPKAVSVYRDTPN